MKLHRPLVNAVAETLQKIFNDGVYADKAVAQILKQNPRWGAKDRRFIAENIYEIVRWKRLLEELISDFDSNGIIYYYRLFAVLKIIRGEELPGWEEFEGIDKPTLLERNNSLKFTRKYRESLPDWLDELGQKELGESIWEKELSALNREARVVLRVNTLKTSIDNLQKKLLNEGVETEKLTGSALFDVLQKEVLILTKRKNLDSLNSYKEGLFEVQDAGSQLIAHYLECKEGMTVIDACAGAGGKTLHISTLMNNKGSIMAMDVEERKLIELRKRALRAGIGIINTQVIAEKALNSLKGKADRLLLDVPCSGLGVLKRNPDAKWKLKPDFIEETKIIQQKILSQYSVMLKSGGIMVYATCSILPGENQMQVKRFLESNPDFQLLREHTVYPSMGFDGFYMAAIKKMENQSR